MVNKPPIIEKIEDIFIIAGHILKAFPLSL